MYGNVAFNYCRKLRDAYLVAKHYRVFFNLIVKMLMTVWFHIFKDLYVLWPAVLRHLLSKFPFEKIWWRYVEFICLWCFHPRMAWRLMKGNVANLKCIYNGVYDDLWLWKFITCIELFWYDIICNVILRVWTSFSWWEVC